MISLVAIALLMSCLARAAGGGLVKLPPKLGFLPELSFGSVFGLVVFIKFGFWWGIASWLWSYGWMETGHNTAFDMGSNPSLAQSGVKHPLSYAIDPLCRWAGQPLGGKFYCWAFMGLKGALIGLPVFPAGFLLAFLWPASYAAGHVFKPGSLVGEFFSGAAAGLVIWLTAC